MDTRLSQQSESPGRSPHPFQTNSVQKTRETTLLRFEERSLNRYLCRPIKTVLTWTKIYLSVTHDTLYLGTSTRLRRDKVWQRSKASLCWKRNGEMQWSRITSQDWARLCLVLPPPPRSFTTHEASLASRGLLPPAAKGDDATT